MKIMGWDIGGAHLKAAVVNSAAEIHSVFQQPCPLWKGIGKLEDAVRNILAENPGPVEFHVLTMTGELVDLFDNRDDGVMRILDAMRPLLGHNNIWVYAGYGGFIEIDKIRSADFSAIASANWLASAGWAAQKLGNGLFIDIGSTTTDILEFKKGRVVAHGYTDYERLISQELVYTGIVRTAVMSLTSFAEDRGRHIGLMAEYFATMADVYRLTGELNERHDQIETADGAAKTVSASARRLARMIGCDFRADELPRWRDFAHNLRTQQVEKIRQACSHRLADTDFMQHAPICGAGIGRFLVKDIAESFNRPYQDFTDLFVNTVSGDGYTPADCAPAAAIAGLYANSLHTAIQENQSGS